MTSRGPFRPKTFYDSKLAVEMTEQMLTQISNNVTYIIIKKIFNYFHAISLTMLYTLYF